MFKCATGESELYRYPRRSNETLQAWDAADEFLLRQLNESGKEPDKEPDKQMGELVLVNDAWGALAIALAKHKPSTLSDSYLSHAGTRENLARNQIERDAVRFLTSFDSLPDRIDTVVMKVPKSLALLEDQLHRIAPHLHDKTKFLAGAMTRHIHMSTLELFEKIIGPTRTSLAEKKARLVFSAPNPTLKRPENPWPEAYTASPGQEVITTHAGVFGAERLDLGTRLLIDNLPRGNAPLRIVDLGCGNGIVGVKAALGNPKAEITFVDESYRAVASAEATFRANLGPERVAHFLVGNGLFDFGSGTQLKVGFDLILNNPPFHDHHAISDNTAWQMFVESRDALRPRGELWVVGNGHLGYQAKLKRLFGDCNVVASNTKFVVLRATKS